MERIVPTNGIEICCETWGNPTDPTVVIIAGSGGQGVLGRSRLTARLVDGRRHVVQYDARDTGRSTCVDFDADPYSLEDMADDLVGLLDALGIDEAHLFGASMGGMVAQEITLEHAERVLTLTSFMSTPAVFDASRPNGWSSPDLPPMDEKVLAAFATFVQPESRDEYVDQMVRLMSALAGPLVPFDVEEARAGAELQYDRATDLAAAGNHNRAQERSRDRTALLRRITVPTLVIHGTVDPIIPFAHGEATAKAIPHARFVAIEGLGHEMPTGIQDRIADLLLEHTA